MSLTQEERNIRKTVRRIDGLRRRIREAQTIGKIIRLKSALEYEIIHRGLELLRETINASNFDLTTVSPEDNDTD